MTTRLPDFQPEFLATPKQSMGGVRLKRAKEAVTADKWLVEGRKKESDGWREKRAEESY